MRNSLFTLGCILSMTLSAQLSTSDGSVLTNQNEKLLGTWFNIKIDDPYPYSNAKANKEDKLSFETDGSYIHVNPNSETEKGTWEFCGEEQSSVKMSLYTGTSIECNTEIVYGNCKLRADGHLEIRIRGRHGIISYLYRKAD